MFSLIPILLLTPNALLILSAVVPAVLLLIYVYRQDRLEKESWRLIGKLVLFGAISTLAAQVLESVGIALLPYVTEAGSDMYYVLLFFVVVGLVEEGCKYFMLRWKTWRNPEFDCRFDGVVYACAVSLGFALWENIAYVISYGFGTALVRAVTAVPGHACFGVFMGAFYGTAAAHRSAGNDHAAAWCRKLSFLVPAILHGIYDYIAGREEGVLVFIVFVAVMFIMAVRIVKKMSAVDRYL